jgi:chitin synthase
LKNGKRDFLSGNEIQFWKDLIEKYLEPLMKDVKKEEKQARELITLRYNSVVRK